MKTKLILIAIAIITLTSCDETGSKYANKHKGDYYWDEDFTLVDRKENSTINDNSPAVIRTWVIQRNLTTNDSIELAVINTVFKNDENPHSNCGCATNKFELTTELWYGKKIGETLHFKFIRNNRFFKKLKNEGVQFGENGEMTKEAQTKPVVVAPVVPTVQPNSMEDQNKILELERQKISIEAELDRLKIK